MAGTDLIKVQGVLKKQHKILTLLYFAAESQWVNAFVRNVPKLNGNTILNIADKYCFFNRWSSRGLVFKAKAGEMLKDVLYSCIC